MSRENLMRLWLEYKDFRGLTTPNTDGKYENEILESELVTEPI